MAGIPLFPKALLFLCFVAFFHVSFATPKPTGLSMRLIRRDSLFPGNLTKAERIKRLLQFSEARAHYLDPVLSPNVTADPDNVRVPIGLVPSRFLYAVETKIGSQLHPVKLLMDTGSGLIWTQCKPCIKCFDQELPIYDSRTSTSYHRLPCTHPLCQGDNNRFKCVDNQCVYSIRYGADYSPDLPRTKGVASFESFKFPVDNVQTRVIHDIVFGCSNDNQNFHDFFNTPISGILGLSRAPDSLATQFATRGITSHRFSYCLVPFNDELEHPSFLRFGDDIPRPRRNLKSTGFLPIDSNSHYNLELLDISVGGHRLRFPPRIFRNRPDGSGGCVVDSGSLVGTIDQKTIGRRNAYKEVMKVFDAHYRSRNLKRIGKVEENLPYCYRSKPGFNDFLSMTLHFNGGDYFTTGEHMHHVNRVDRYFCVALRPASITILGLWQQQDMRIIYDMNARQLQWVTAPCAFDIP